MTRRLVADIAAAAARHVATMAAGLLVVALVVRRLDAAALGAWSVLGTTAFLLGLTDLGLSTVVQRRIAAGQHADARRLVAHARWLILVLAPLVGVALAPGLIAITERAHDPAPTLAVALTIAAGAVGALLVPWQAVALSRGAVVGLARARAAGATVQVIGTAAGLAIWPTLAAPAGALLAAAVVELALVSRAARTVDPGLDRQAVRPRGRALVSVMRESGAALAVHAAVAVAIRVDVLVLAQVASLEIVAAYGVASRAVDQAFGLAKQASAALLPRLGDVAARAEAVRLGTAVLGAVTAAALVGLAVAGGPLLVAWAGDAARSPVTADAVTWLGVAAVLAAAGQCAASMLSLGAPSAWTGAWPIVVGAGVNITLSLAGARWLGPWAVAAATVVGNSVTLTLAWRHAARLLRWNAGQVARALAPIAAAGLAAIVVAGLAPTPVTVAGALLVCAAVGVGGLAAAAATLRAQAARRGSASTSAYSDASCVATRGQA